MALSTALSVIRRLNGSIRILRAALGAERSTYDLEAKVEELYNNKLSLFTDVVKCKKSVYYGRVYVDEPAFVRLWYSAFLARVVSINTDKLSPVGAAYWRGWRPASRP